MENITILGNVYLSRDLSRNVENIYWSDH